MNDLNEIDRQSNDLEARGRQKENENDMLRKEYDKAQQQISQQLADLQAYERKVDALGRELSKKEDLLDKNGRQKTVLLEEVQCTERQRFQYENEIKECRRQLAQLESLLESGQAKVDDDEQEIIHLKNQLRFSNDKARIGKKRVCMPMFVHR